MSARVQQPSTTRWAVVVLAVTLSAAQARGSIVKQYQQGVSDGGTYQHLGSEIRNSTPDGNGGGGGLIRSGGDNRLRTVLTFDLNVPANYTVAGVQLRMHADSIEGPGPLVEVHQITNPT